MIILNGRDSLSSRNKCEKLSHFHFPNFVAPPIVPAQRVGSAVHIASMRKAFYSPCAVTESYFCFPVMQDIDIIGDLALKRNIFDYQDQILKVSVTVFVQLGRPHSSPGLCTTVSTTLIR